MDIQELNMQTNPWPQTSTRALAGKHGSHDGRLGEGSGRAGLAGKVAHQRGLRMEEESASRVRREGKAPEARRRHGEGLCGRRPTREAGAGESDSVTAGDLHFRRWPPHRLVGIYFKTYTPVFPSYPPPPRLGPDSICFHLPSIFSSLKALEQSRIRRVSSLLSVRHGP